MSTAPFRKARIFHDGEQWVLDAIDGEGDCTEACKTFDSFDAAIEAMPEFYAEHVLGVTLHCSFPPPGPGQASAPAKWIVTVPPVGPESYDGDDLCPPYGPSVWLSRADALRFVRLVVSQHARGAVG